ncbi:hypothetical protein F5Y17DRAFT_442873 [Xylariaceae sp. FL0594]|nr:hypothetical protein F5Y17DRAFT_442873 [Xylariaceae sp. FL0594]
MSDMRRGEFPITNLPTWCTLNNIKFHGVSAASIEGRGLGLVAEDDLGSDGENDTPVVLLTIPKDLVLSSAGVEEYAKESKEFRQLLDVAGGQSLRGDILLFLLTQLVLSSPDYTGGLGPSTGWTQYFKLLPTQVPVPTMWAEAELSLLRGISLESAVSAKLATLAKEFNHLREAASSISFWNEVLNVDEAIGIRDWIGLDALYRSRSLGLPTSGESMVPCLDLVNHSSPATAYFEENENEEVLLLLRPGSQVKRGEEITINYGHDKPAAEMLFSYGFVDLDSPARSILLPVESMEDDPLAKAKLYILGSSPTLKITDRDTGIPQWDAPFVHLMCLNAEDGLNFKVLQETDGSTQLRLFWQEADVTSQAGNMESVVQSEKLASIFRLRVVTVVLDMVQNQLDALAREMDESVLTHAEKSGILRAATHLREVEQDLFERVSKVLEDERTQLLEDPEVIAYLTVMDAGQEEDIDDEDFT